MAQELEEWVAALVLVGGRSSVEMVESAELAWGGRGEASWPVLLEAVVGEVVSVRQEEGMVQVLVKQVVGEVLKFLERGLVESA